MHFCLSYNGVTKLSKEERCIYFAEVTHLPNAERFTAAMWCIDQFGYDNVNILGTKTFPGRYKDQTIHGFYFSREKYVTMFKLAWG